MILQLGLFVGIWLTTLGVAALGWFGLNERSRRRRVPSDSSFSGSEEDLIGGISHASSTRGTVSPIGSNSNLLSSSDPMTQRSPTQVHTQINTGQPYGYHMAVRPNPYIRSHTRPYADYNTSRRRSTKTPVSLTDSEPGSHCGHRQNSILQGQSLRLDSRRSSAVAETASPAIVPPAITSPALSYSLDDDNDAISFGDLQDDITDGAESGGEEANACFLAKGPGFSEAVRAEQDLVREKCIGLLKTLKLACDDESTDERTATAVVVGMHDLFCQELSHIFRDSKAAESTALSMCCTALLEVNGLEKLSALGTRWSALNEKCTAIIGELKGHLDGAYCCNCREGRAPHMGHLM